MPELEGPEKVKPLSAVVGGHADWNLDRFDLRCGRLAAPIVAVVEAVIVDAADIGANRDAIVIAALSTIISREKEILMNGRLGFGAFLAPHHPIGEHPALQLQRDLQLAELLDQLLNHAGEVSIARARLEQQLGAIEFNLGELSRTVTRLKEQLRKLEIETETQILHGHEEKGGSHRGDFDPLELDRYSAIQQFSRALAETARSVCQTGCSSTKSHRPLSTTAKSRTSVADSPRVIGFPMDTSST